MITQKKSEKEVRNSIVHSRITSYAKDTYDYQILQSIYEQLPIIIQTLKPIDSAADTAKRRKYYLGYLFFFEPRFLRIAGIMNACNIQSIKDNKANIIDYFTKTTYDGRLHAM